MKTKLIILLIIFIVCVSLLFSMIISCTKKSKTKDTVSYKGVVYLENSLVTDKNVMIFLRKDNSDYATLPFIDLLKKLNFSVEWENEFTAKIKYEDDLYILSLSDPSNPSLTSISGGFNWLLPPPGTDCYYLKIIEKDILLDDLTIRGILNMMGIKLKSNIDEDSKSICFYISE